MRGREYKKRDKLKRKRFFIDCHHFLPFVKMMFHPPQDKFSIIRPVLTQIWISNEPTKKSNAKTAFLAILDQIKWD